HSGAHHARGRGRKSGTWSRVATGIPHAGSPAAIPHFPGGASMRNRRTRIGLLALVNLSLLPVAAIAQTDEVGQVHPPTEAELYESLGPYGTWFQTAAGPRAWQPHPDMVGPGFVPYATNGQWYETEAGWYFDSFYDWGWVAFHYGRWLYDLDYG